jgi:hypothetical protein
MNCTPYIRHYTILSNIRGSLQYLAASFFNYFNNFVKVTFLLKETMLKYRPYI